MRKYTAPDLTNIGEQALSVYNSPLGRIILSFDATHLLGLWFENQHNAPKEYKVSMESGEVLELTRRWLDEYFSGSLPDFTPPLNPQGTPFRRRVWSRLLTIPYGTTATYGEIARGLGLGGGAQAVGGAVGANPISIIIPCHRVVGADGSLTGYASGLDRKLWLLNHELL